MGLSPHIIERAFNIGANTVIRTRPRPIVDNVTLYWSSRERCDIHVVPDKGFYRYRDLHDSYNGILVETGIILNNVFNYVDLIEMKYNILISILQYNSQHHKVYNYEELMANMMRRYTSRYCDFLRERTKYLEDDYKYYSFQRELRSDIYHFFYPEMADRYEKWCQMEMVRNYEEKINMRQKQPSLYLTDQIIYF